ncbi:response regulator [Tundrisphaera sp. TA3]|uniref:response regulator n=1 Tax=Tundrisphaera sp. TA3 TaxID=3435775 RepID=UPI003EBF98BD
MGSRERRVLIIDDSPEDRETVRRYLGKDREIAHVFSEESTGLNGLAACRQFRPDCVLLDYDLPDLNGLEFLSELTGGAGHAPFPIVMLTGRGEEAVAVLALKSGAHDYLVKGHFTPEILLQTVADAIAKVETHRELESQRVELEKLYGETREADLRKDEFLAMLAHELRNPLSIILNAVHLLKLRDGDRQSGERMREMIERQVRHLCRLVDDLLDVSRITRGKIQLRTETIDLAAIASTAVEDLRNTFDHRRQTFSLTLPDGPIRMEADPTRMEQVIVNLLNNASKYTETGGSIAMDVAREDGCVSLAVRDNGVGIAPEMLTRVFDLFSQAERSLDRSQGGLGIGLTLVRNLVQMHGGEVVARSDGTGQGSEFTVRLPIPDIQIEAGARADRVAGPAPVHRPTRVLVVDDNVHAAESLAMVIQIWDHETRVVHNGTDAIEAVAEFRPQVVLLDIGLPGRDGYSVAGELRGLPEGREILLVAMTGYGREEDFRRSSEAGFDHHLVKPLDFDNLERILADVPSARASSRAVKA